MSHSSMSSTSSELTDDLDSDGHSTNLYLQPYSVIVKNLPPTESKSYTALGRHILNKLDIEVQKVLSVRSETGERGHAILIFGSTAEDFKTAMQLHIHFDSARRGKMEWEMPVLTRQPFGWMATPKDVDEFADRADQYVPCSVPGEWIEEAFARKNADTRNVYRTIRLFAARFAYMKFN